MEKPAPTSPVGQRFTLGPIKLKYKLGTLQGYASVSLEQAKAISKSASRLKRFRNTPLPIRDPARVAISKNTLSWGVFDVADVRDAMKAGDVELFFTVLTLYGPRGHFACLSDPTILGITQGWWDAANSGDRDARALLDRISPALARASYRRPPLPATEQPLTKRDAVAVSKIVSRRLLRYLAFREKRLPAEARFLIEDELQKNPRILPERKPAILSSFRGKARKLEETRSGHKA